MNFSLPELPFDIVVDGDRIIAQSKTTGNGEAATRSELLLYALLVELKGGGAKLVEHVEQIDKDVEPKKPSTRKSTS